MTEQTSPGKLYKRGDGKVPRVCPVCGSADGRVAMAKDADGHATNVRGWLCFNCGYFPGKDLTWCRLNARLNERESSGAIFYDA